MNFTRNMTFTTVATIALVVSAGLNVALAVRVAQQRNALEHVDTPVQLQIGRRIEPFDARDSIGRVVRLDLQAADRPTVLYTFRPGCAWCERNHEAVVALHSQLADRYQFVGISLSEDHPSTMLERYPLPFDVVSGVDSRFVETYQLGGTPRTLVIDSNGAIEANYFGAYIGSTRRMMADRFDVDLPVVREDE